MDGYKLKMFIDKTKDYFFVVSALILFALVSTVVVVVSVVTGAVTAELSTCTFVESEVVDSVLDESSQAAKIDATANTKNTFFIFRFFYN